MNECPHPIPQHRQVLSPGFVGSTTSLDPWDGNSLHISCSCYRPRVYLDPDSLAVSQAQEVDHSPVLCCCKSWRASLRRISSSLPCTTVPCTSHLPQAPDPAAPAQEPGAIRALPGQKLRACWLTRAHKALICQERKVKVYAFQTPQDLTYWWNTMNKRS